MCDDFRIARDGLREGEAEHYRAQRVSKSRMRLQEYERLTSSCIIFDSTDDD